MHALQPKHRPPIIPREDLLDWGFKPMKRRKIRTRKYFRDFFHLSYDSMGLIGQPNIKSPLVPASIFLIQVGMIFCFFVDVDQESYILSFFFLKFEFSISIKLFLL